MTNDITHILAVVNQVDDGEIVLQKAETVARVSGADIHVVKVLYESFLNLTFPDVEQSLNIKNRLIGTEETLLEGLIAPIRASTDLKIDAQVLWRKYESQGIVDAAREVGADLIIKSTNHPVPEIIRTPQDWHLLRHSHVPVMLVKPLTWKTHPLILAAIDIDDPHQEDLNIRILQSADRINRMLGGRLYLVNAYPGIGPWLGPVTPEVDIDLFRKSVSAAIEKKLRALADRFDIQPDLLLAAEGRPQDALEKLVADQGAEILIMGTSQREGPIGLVIGNTSEDILHQVNSDVLVLK